MLKKVQWFGVTLAALAVLGSTDLILDFLPKGWLFLTFMWYFTLWALYMVRYMLITHAKLYHNRVLGCSVVLIALTFPIAQTLVILNMVTVTVLLTTIAWLLYILLAYWGIGCILLNINDVRCSCDGDKGVEHDTKIH